MPDPQKPPTLDDWNAAPVIPMDDWNAAQPVTVEKPQTVGRLVTETLHKSNPLPLIHTLMSPEGVDPVERDALHAAGAPLGTGNVVRAIVQQQKGEWQKAQEAFKSGHYGNAVMYALSTAAPVVGPMATSFGEDVKEGDYVGAASTVLSAGLAAKGPKIVGKMAGAAETALPAVEAAAKARQAGKASQGSARLMADLSKALPPSAKTYAPNDVIRATPYLASEHGSAPITSVEALKDSAQSAITQIEHQVSGYIDAHPNDLIRTNPLAKARAVLSQGARSSDVELGMRELSDLGLDQPMTLQQADAIRLRLNQENSVTLAKNNIDQFKARTTDPAFAAREAVAEALRDGIYNQLAERGVSEARDLRLDEGALMKIRNAANKQMYAGERPVAGTGTNTMTARVLRRTLPIAGAAAGSSVAGFLGAGMGAETGIALARRMASPNMTRNALIERAFKNLEGVKGPQYPVMPPDVAPRGLLPSAPIASHVPDTSSVRGVPAAISPSNIRALPAHEGRPMGPSPDRSRIDVIEARGTVVRDPKTGRFKRVYTTEGAR